MAYIPTKDSDLVAWADNWFTLLVADPALYGVSVADATLQQVQAQAYIDAYAEATNPTTRSPTTVAHKNGTKALFLADARALAAIIRVNEGVDDADKTALGLNIPDPIPTPIPTPTTYAILGISDIAEGYHELVYHDQLTPTTKKKPFGVINVLIFRAFAIAPLNDFDSANPTLIAAATKSPFPLTTPPAQQGKFATYWAQYMTRTGKFGPVGPPKSVMCA